jgi:thiamine biosynthesis lipoprotein
MGTTLVLQTSGAPTELDVAEEAKSLVERMEGVFSRFRTDSELNRFAQGETALISSELACVLAAAENARIATSGAFDVRATGHLDLGGIAKGYVSDAVRDLCRAAGVQGACVSAGSSSVATYGTHADGSPWRVALRAPGSERHSAVGILKLPTGWSLSVSGFDEQTGHIRDPRSGAVASSDTVQAAVATDSGMNAEVWSTALLVLGTAGMELLLTQHPDAQVVLITAQRIIATPGWFQPLTTSESLAAKVPNKQ